MILEEGEELASRLVALDDGVADVRPVERGGEDRRVLEAQALDDVAARRGVGRGGERDARHGRIVVGERLQRPVFRPEVMAPRR